MNQERYKLLLVKVLLALALPVLSQGMYSTRLIRGELIVFEVSGNVSREEPSAFNLQEALDEAEQRGISVLVFEVEEFLFQTTLVVRRSLVISSRPQNSSKTQLRCGRRSQIFDIERRKSQEDITAELRNLTITGCTTRDPDGVVHVGSGARIVFEGVELVNNTADGVNHAIVVVDSNTVLEVIGGSSFSGNHGRVMLVGNGSDVSIENSSFRNNIAATNGTVLATKPGSGIRLNARGSQFVGNVARENSGGVMWLESSNATLENDVQFISNVAGYHGGALFLNESLELGITDALFENNSCQLGKGGAVFIVSASSRAAQIRRSIFTRNSANGVMGMGGAIAFGNTVRHLRRMLELGADVLFLKNTARVSGGAVIVNGTNATIESFSSFVQNTAQGEGGGLHITSAIYHISATSYVVGSVSEASFISNSAPVRGGGAIVVRGGAEFSIVNTNCTNNMADVGGAVFAYDDVRVSIVNDTLFKDNWATRGGGSITVFNGRNMSLSMCRCENNHASLRGGGIYVMSTAVFSAASSSFVGNRAGHGGAINIENQATLRGRTTAVRLTDVTFLSNSASTPMHETGEAFGGAVRVTGIGVNTEIEGCTFQNNQGGLGGGLYLLEAFRTQIENSSFTGNVAARGGATYVVPLERVRHGDQDATTFTACIFTGNQAQSGGALFGRSERLNHEEIPNLSRSLLTLSGCSLSENKARESGGGLSVLGMNVSIVDSFFYGNNATSKDAEGIDSVAVASSHFGGALYASAGSEIRALSTYFELNSAREEGGALYIRDAFLNCSRNCSFSQNKARNGGAVYSVITTAKIETNRTALLHCTVCNFEHNAADRGGAIYTSIPEQRVTVHRQRTCRDRHRGSKNTTNSSQAIGSTEDYMFLNQTDLNDNTAKISGHAVFSTRPALVIVIDKEGSRQHLIEYDHKRRITRTKESEFSSIPCYVLKSDHVLKNLNRGDTGKELEKLEFRIVDCFGHIVPKSRVSIEIKACEEDENCCPCGKGKEDTTFRFFSPATKITTTGIANFSGLEISDENIGKTRRRLWACFEDDGEEAAMLEPMPVDVSFRGCYKMERPDVHARGGCSECDLGQYHVKENGTCTNCPEHASCRGLTIIPDDGFWHAASVSDKIYDCHPREACVEDKERQREQAVTKAHRKGKILNWTHPNYDQCNTGYEGILCGSCKEDHGRWNDICTECLGIPLMWISLFVSVGWNLLVLLLFIYSARSIVKRVQYNQQATSQHQRTRSPSPSRAREVQQTQMIPRIANSFLRGDSRQMSLPSSSDVAAVKTGMQRWIPSTRSILRRRSIQETIPSEPLPLTNPLSEALKIILNFMQMIYLAALLSEDLPSIFRWSIIPFDSLNLTETVFLTADCLLKGYADRAMIRMTLQALFPLLLFFLVCLVPVLLLILRKNFDFGLQEVRLVALCTIYLYFTPEVRNLLKFLDAITIEDEEANLETTHFWSVDTSVMFLRGPHSIVVGAIVCPLLIAFTICFPFSLFVSLKKNKDRMQEEDVVSSYGFLYKGYESKYYYWEIVIVIRKTVIAIVSVFVQNAELQSVLISLTLVLFLSLQLIVSPYNSSFPGLNILESLSLGVTTLMFLGVSLMLRSYELGNDQLLNTIAWCTLFVLVFTLLGMMLGLVSATEEFLTDKLIEIKVYPDRKSVEHVAITTKTSKLIGFYFRQLHSRLADKVNSQAPSTNAGQI